MAIVVAVAGVADVIEGGLWHILEHGGAHLAELIDEDASAVI